MHVVKKKVNSCGICYFIASTSTYNYLLMALDSSQSPVAWETAMELAKNMTQTPSVHPDISTLCVVVILLWNLGCVL